MRVAFFTQGRKVPASRFRVEQLVPALEKHVECTVLPATPSVYGDIGNLRGRQRMIAKPLSVVSRIRQLGVARRCDVAWMQRPMTEYFTTVFESWVTRRTTSVFDIDDAIFHNRWGLEASKIRHITDRVDHVVAGNAYLAAFVNRPEKLTIIPTVVDEHRYAVRPDPGEDTAFTIVWTGMSQNLTELAPWVPALKTVLEQTRGKLVVVADALHPAVADLPVEFVRWSPDTEVAALASGHVGIMPLADTRYNRGKCAFKLIQYMARGIPVVCSPVGANREVVRDGIEGMYAVDERSWIDSLVALARDHGLRSTMGRAGRARVEEAYCVTAVVPKYLDVLRTVA